MGNGNAQLEKPTEQQAQPKSSLQILEQLMPAIKDRNFQNTDMQNLVKKSQSLGDIQKGFGNLSKHDQIEFLVTITILAQEKFGEQKSREVLTPFFQQLGIAQQLIDFIFKTVLENMAKGNKNIDVMVNQMISQNFIDKDREDKLGQQKETKEQLKDVQYSPLIAVVSQRRQFSKPSTC